MRRSCDQEGWKFKLVSKFSYLCKILSLNFEPFFTEIGLPKENGRAQILTIHTRKMRTNEKLHKDVDIKELAALTKNFSGAEIEGLVRAAQSRALNRYT